MSGKQQAKRTSKDATAAAAYPAATAAAGDASGSSAAAAAAVVSAAAAGKAAKMAKPIVLPPPPPLPQPQDAQAQVDEDWNDEGGMGEQEEQDDEYQLLEDGNAQNLEMDDAIFDDVLDENANASEAEGQAQGHPVNDGGGGGAQGADVSKKLHGGDVPPGGDKDPNAMLKALDAKFRELMQKALNDIMKNNQHLLGKTFQREAVLKYLDAVESAFSSNLMFDNDEYKVLHCTKVCNSIAGELKCLDQCPVTDTLEEVMKHTSILWPEFKELVRRSISDPRQPSMHMLHYQTRKRKNGQTCLAFYDHLAQCLARSNCRVATSYLSWTSALARMGNLKLFVQVMARDSEFINGDENDFKRVFMEEESKIMLTLDHNAKSIPIDAVKDFANQQPKGNTSSQAKRADNNNYSGAPKAKVGNNGKGDNRPGGFQPNPEMKARMQWARQNNVCARCLKPGHIMKVCHAPWGNMSSMFSEASAATKAPVARGNSGQSRTTLGITTDGVPVSLMKGN